MKPIKLEPNLVRRFYRGGASIADFRNIPVEDEYVPEDWVGSMTATLASHREGPTRLPDGRMMREAIVSNRKAFFDERHLKRFGSDSALLVKLLDAGERLPVHCHPDREFTRKWLGGGFGKTEGWVIVAAKPESVIHLGFRYDVDRDTLAGWVNQQNKGALLDALHVVPVRAGDTIFVPAGIPHAIGEGIFMVELQEATDFSILLEWEGFQLDGANEGHLGLGFDKALEAVDTAAWTPEQLEALRAERPGGRGVRPGVNLLFPPEADAFFRAERIQTNPVSPLPAAFSILVALFGFGEIQFPDGGVVPIARGDTVLIPYAAGDCQLAGLLDVVRCLPAEPVDATIRSGWRPEPARAPAPTA